MRTKSQKDLISHLNEGQQMRTRLLYRAVHSYEFALLIGISFIIVVTIATYGPKFLLRKIPVNNQVNPKIEVHPLRRVVGDKQIQPEVNGKQEFVTESQRQKLKLTHINTNIDISENTDEISERSNLESEDPKFEDISTTSSIIIPALTSTYLHLNGKSSKSSDLSASELNAGLNENNDNDSQTRIAMGTPSERPKPGETSQVQPVDEELI